MSPKKFSRREFVKFSLLVGTAAALPASLGARSKGKSYSAQIEQTWKVLKQEKGRELYEMVRYATLAANSHNSQPWKFSIQDNRIEILADFSRALPVVDPNNRSLWISLGCALENLVIAGRACGFVGEIVYPESDKPRIQVVLSADAPQSSPLFDAIPLRQNTRSQYDGRTVEMSAFHQVESTPLERGTGLMFAVTPAEMETVIEYVTAGNLKQYSERAFVDELIDWLRFNESEALASLDGLYSKCSGNPTVPRWLGSMFVSGTKPTKQADADAKKLRSSAGAVVITSETDDEAAWVRVGQVYQRLVLTMTSHNIKSALLNQPIEVTELRGQFQSALNLGENRPQLLIRFGYADPLPKSLRRPVEAVLI